MSLKAAFHRLCTKISREQFSIKYWDGERVSYGAEGAPERFSVTFRSAEACARLLRNLSVGFGEGYMASEIEIEGDWKGLFSLLYTSNLGTLKISPFEALKALEMGWRQRNTLKNTRRNISHHYDLGNDFFKLWLGKEMAYSCGYFRTATDDLDTAQRQKFRHICEKLRLEPEMSLLDIGCGWGGLAIFAAKEYGCRVKGITLSTLQRNFAAERVKDESLTDRVQIELTDYRKLSAPGRFERIVSVGMLEHVGQTHIGDYIRRTALLTADGGGGVLHTIGRTVEAPVNPWLKKYIFPGLYVPSLSELATPMARYGLRITDVEDLRAHYALTLDSWSEGFERNVNAIRAKYGEGFVRMWRFYLRCCSASFANGNSCLWQVQYTKGLSTRIPLTRDYLYRG